MDDESKIAPKATVSIALIDQVLFSSALSIDTEDVSDIYEILFESLKEELGHFTKTMSSFNNDLSGFFYEQEGKTIEWEKFIKDALDNDLDNASFKTRFPSYILLKKIDNLIFVITAGKGNSIIDKYKDKSFGINLIPKVLINTEQVIKTISDRRVYGKRNATRFTNRSASNFALEQNYESIYKELVVSLSPPQQKKLGLIPEVNADGNYTNKNITVTFGANVQVHKKLSLEELMTLLNVLKDKHLSPDVNFVINYLQLSDKKGVKQKTLDDSYFVYLKDNPEVNIVYNPFLENNLVSYNLVKSDGKVIVYTEDNTTADLETIKSYILTKLKDGTNPETLLKRYKLIATDNNIDTDYEIPLFNLIETEFEYQGTNYYLMDGDWYCFEEGYMNYLNERYNDFLDESKANTSFLKDLDKSLKIKECGNEEKLKTKISKSDRLIDSDMAYLGGIEIADAIFLNDNEIIFLHNKKSFNGAGTRDLMNQITSAAEMVNRVRRNENDVNDLLDKYIVSLKKDKSKRKTSLQNNDFNEVNRFYELLKNNSTKITYIAVYIENVKFSTKSNYIKYLLVNTRNKLHNININMFVY